MNKWNKLAALTAAATCVSVVSAESVFLDFEDVQDGSEVTIVGIGNVIAGHMRHGVYTDVAGTTQTGDFYSFCIELQNTDRSNISEYQIVNLTDAPDPDLSGSDTSYTQAQADAVVEAVAKAVQLDWITSNLQMGADGNSDRMTAIQMAIWIALDFGDFNSIYTTSNFAADLALSHLLFNTTVDANIETMMAGRLRAAVADGEQDMLYVVPLPPAAWAGLGLLGVCAGVRQARRRG